MAESLISVFAIGLGLYLFILGFLTLRVNQRMSRMPKRPMFGPGVDKHILQTGIEIEHGMVLTKSNVLQPQSKISKGFLESILLK